MLFSSTLFLFVFLPVFLGLYLALPNIRLRNALLLAGSLFFYAWGETVYVLILVASIGLNYVLGLWIERQRDRPAGHRALVLAVGLNLLILTLFKYANFLIDNLNLVLGGLGVDPIVLAPVHLPLGISFFSFQAITYAVDIYRRQASAQKNPLRVALYIALFPQLIAGPIVRYKQIAAQLQSRTSRLEDIAEGIRRFIVGLAKKVLIANTLALPADRIFSVPGAQLEPSVAWLGIVCFSFQIYFDFAGYSDMAIGLGRCFGFRFPENFDWPLLSRSMREFWRRWHMTLSGFFRDYVYIPLGGNRRGGLRTGFNLVTVFFLCGLWHGASWNFVLWGLVHGAFLAAERLPLGGYIRSAPRAVQSFYTLGVMSLAWVFFRTDDLSHANAFFAALVGLGGLEEGGGAYPVALYLNNRVLFVLGLASLSALPRFGRGWEALSLKASDLGLLHETIRFAALFGVLGLCAMSLAMGTYNPFIYFRF
jgi:alginate O-acetyltransferase complex protein AlgI